MRVLAYLPGPAEIRPYDPAVKAVAQIIADAIRKAEPRLQIEHIGSTSVPGCKGKGIVDLAILYPHGLLATAREVLDGLGFQKQGGTEPFPEERPMRVGCVQHDGNSYRVHAHVLALGCEEHFELVWFRDRLRSDAALREQYENRKQAIVDAGIVDSLEYCKAKGAFITEILKTRQRALNTA
jgi:GrpB-like predicted nucleotidyltransferase (UPF0157 family)